MPFSTPASLLQSFVPTARGVRRSHSGPPTPASVPRPNARGAKEQPHYRHDGSGATSSQLARSVAARRHVMVSPWLEVEQQQTEEAGLENGTDAVMLAVRFSFGSYSRRARQGCTDDCTDDNRHAPRLWERMNDRGRKGITCTRPVNDTGACLTTRSPGALG